MAFPFLSAREIQILELIAVGKSNQEISTQLYLALSTVKCHAYNIYSKLEVRKRNQALKPLGAARSQKRTTQPIWSNQNVSSREKVSSQYEGARLPNPYERDKEDDKEPVRERCNGCRHGTTKR